MKNLGWFCMIEPQLATVVAADCCIHAITETAGPKSRRNRKAARIVYILQHFAPLSEPVGVAFSEGYIASAH
jgi:hypothetical protein